jgi:hypothetical protein
MKKLTLIEVEQMWVGDRFRAHGSVWTYLGATDEKYATARKHSPESIALNDRGHGYFGDTICTFERKERVEFVAPLHDTAPELLKACKALLLANEKQVSFDQFVAQFGFGQDHAVENALDVIAKAENES